MLKTNKISNRFWVYMQYLFTVCRQKSEPKQVFADFNYINKIMTRKYVKKYH